MNNFSILYYKLLVANTTFFPQTFIYVLNHGKFCIFLKTRAIQILCVISQRMTSWVRDVLGMTRWSSLTAAFRDPGTAVWRGRQTIRGRRPSRWRRWGLGLWGWGRLRVRGGGHCRGSQCQDGRHDGGSEKGGHRGGAEVPVQQALPGNGAREEAKAAQDPRRPRENQLLSVDKTGAHEQRPHSFEER